MSFPIFHNQGALSGGGASNFLDTLTDLSLTSGLKLCLDPASADSYPGSGQTFFDQTANNTDFYLGSDGTVQSSDPVYNAAGYFDLDGTQAFNVQAQPSWANNLHKTGAKFTMLAWAYMGGTATHGIMGTNNSNKGGVGMNFSLEADGTIKLIVTNGNGFSNPPALGVGGPTFSTGVWAMYSVSLDEVGGASGSFLQINNGTPTTFNGDYTSPSTSAAGRDLCVASMGGMQNPLPAGSRYGKCAIWEGVALTSSQINNIFNQTKAEYGL